MLTVCIADVLPHILFNNAEVPWLNAENGGKDTTDTLPWIGLLVFTADELTMSSTLKDTLGSCTSSKGPLIQSPTLAVNMTLDDLRNMDNLISQPVSVGDTTIEYDTAVQAIFLPGSLFDSLFASYAKGSVAPLSNISQPDITKFVYMSHVRQVNTTGMANKDKNEVGTFSVTLSPRCGPLTLSTPTVAYAHLVSLSGVNRMVIPTGKSQDLTALVSLYSWSYTCLPTSGLSVGNILDNLGRSIQPLRNPDSLLKPPPSTLGVNSTWVLDRMLAGYTVARYRTPTGEPTVALQRSLLVPTSNSSSDMPSSDFGTDLAVLDKSVGALDLTFQLAWELGRTLAMADRAFAAALTRLRTSIHVQSLAQAKVSVDQKSTSPSFVAKGAVCPALPGMAATLGNLDDVNGTVKLDFSQRWRKPSTGTGSRASLSFKVQAVRDQYVSQVDLVTSSHAQASSTNPSSQGSIEAYNELNSPAYPDYAVLLSWCMDKWFLSGIPFVNLIVDPAFLPKESIRTFYVDQTWFKSFMDGALSITEHFTRGDDAIRTALKKSFDNYLKTPLQNGHPPQVPQWGFFIRSEVIIKFSDLRISAPWTEPTDTRAEVLRMDTIDRDLLLVLFDRTPDAGGFPQGITLQPPEHQLSFVLGTVGYFKGDEVVVEWKKVYTDSTLNQDYSTQLTPGHYPRTNTSSGVFDFAARCLCFPHFALAAQAALGDPSWPGNPATNLSGPTAGLTGAQLLADVPKLVLEQPKFDVLSSGQTRLPPQISPSTTQTTITDGTMENGVEDVQFAAQLAVQMYNRSTAAVIVVTETDPDSGYNESYPAISSGTQLVSYVPVSQGFLVDVHVSLKSNAICSNWRLVEATVSFPVGNSANDVFAAFPLSSDFTNSKPTPSLSSYKWDYPVKPNFSGLRLPTVRSVGGSGRWNLDTFYLPTGDNDSGPEFLVRVWANNDCTSDWDIFEVRDLSFIIEGVQLNWWGTTIGVDTTTFTVVVTEIYNSWPGGGSNMTRNPQTVVVHALDASLIGK